MGALAPKMPPRAPKTPPGGLPDTPGGLPEAPLRRPRGLPEAPETGHGLSYVLCFHQGQAECAKRLNKIRPPPRGRPCKTSEAMKAESLNLECPGPLRIPPGVRLCGLKMAKLGLKLLQKLFQKLFQIFNKKCCFTTVLATSDVIFWPFRTPEFIVKY